MNKDIMNLLQTRYFLLIENAWSDIVKRVSRIYPKSYNLINSMKFVPGSPTLMNANTKGERLGTLSSCFPMAIGDSIIEIYDSLKEGALVTKMGGGIGYDFSILRGSSELINTIKRNSSGPLGFISNFNDMLDKIQQGGVRRGAGMAQLSIYHPNILDFIEAKKDYRNTNFTRFNFSIRIPDEFYKVLETAPETPHQVYNVVDKKPIVLINSDGTFITVKDLWGKIIHHAWLSAEPGIFNSDIAFRQCTVTNVSREVLSNPCQEFISIPYSSCNLGSLNLSKFVRCGKFDWKSYEKAIEIATVFLDNVIDNNIYPLKKIEKVTHKIRPIGLGIMGLAHMFYQMEIPYNSLEAKTIFHEIMHYTTLKSMKVSVELAKKKGRYEAFDYNTYINANARFFQYSEWRNIDVDKLKGDIKKYGVRHHSNTSIAPTGSIGFIAHTSSGIEPVYALTYTRKIEKIDRNFDKVYITDPIFERHLNKYHKKDKNKILEFIVNNNGSCKHCDLLSNKEKNVFVTAMDITPMEHLNVLEVACQNTSLSVSKTINIPREATEKDISNVYLEAHKKGIIGVTVYRDGSREGILISDNTKAIPKTKAPKRPIDLMAEIHHFIIKKQKYYVVVGLYESEPYEVFTGINYDNQGEVYIPKHVNKGKVVKECRGKYSLYVKKDEQYTLTNGHTDDNADALTRMISTGLRHGVDISFVVHQLEKTKGEMISFAKALSRALKKHIIDGTKVFGEECPQCKNHQLVREGGCIVCKRCGWGLCS